jgi:hypothetical protein
LLTKLLLSTARGSAAGLWVDLPSQVWSNYVHDADELVMVIAVEFEIDGKATAPPPARRSSSRPGLDNGALLSDPARLMERSRVALDRTLTQDAVRCRSDRVDRRSIAVCLCGRFADMGHAIRRRRRSRCVVAPQPRLIVRAQHHL